MCGHLDYEWILGLQYYQVLYLVLSLQHFQDHMLSLSKVHTKKKKGYASLVIQETSLQLSVVISVGYNFH